VNGRNLPTKPKGMHPRALLLVDCHSGLCRQRKVSAIKRVCYLKDRERSGFPGMEELMDAAFERALQRIPPQLRERPRHVSARQWRRC
jgi:hypothetical protein